MSIIPVDCFVLKGNSVVDEATMTGESFPATKTMGSFLMSGTRNISSPIVAVVTAEQHESTLERLIDNISSATEQSSDTNQNVDLIVRHFVAGILFLALFGFFCIVLHISGRTYQQIQYCCSTCDGNFGRLVPMCIGTCKSLCVDGWHR